MEIRVSAARGGRKGAPYVVIFDHPYFSGERPPPTSGDADAVEAGAEKSAREAESVEAGAENPASDDVPDKPVFNGQIVHISISHDGDYATAVCIAPEEAMPGDVGGEAEARGL
jgi:holo-[acyl-carrier protein] synthase